MGKRCSLEQSWRPNCSLQKVEVTEAIVGQVKQVTFKAASLQKQPVHVNVFSLMESVLDMLNENLLHIKVVRHSSTDSAKVEVTLMNLLGEEIGERVRKTFCML